MLHSCKHPSSLGRGSNLLMKYIENALSLVSQSGYEEV